MTPPWLTDPNWRPRTVTQIIADLAVFTDAQRSLAWSPQPPYEPMGASDCRPSGGCALDFNRETRRGRWAQASFRWQQEQSLEVLSGN